MNKETTNFTNYTNIMALTRKNLWRLRGDLSLERVRTSRVGLNMTRRTDE